MKKNNKKGFTLVELVIVVAVMAILVAVAIPTVASITGTADEAVFNTNCRTIESMIKLEEAELSNDGKELSHDAVITALNDAKLGIEDGEFYYHVSTGIVDGNAPATGSTEVVYSIFFTDGVAAKTAATPATTGAGGAG